MIYFQDIFLSIQGESTDAGLPTLFVRMFGCNVQCTFCDQPQSKSDRKRISVDNLISLIRTYSEVRNVCITGGEPLIQPEIYPVIYSLVENGYRVSIETNGCVPIDEDTYKRSFKYVMDVKCPSSGVSANNVLSNLRKLLPQDEVKFVVSDRKDYLYAVQILRDYPTLAKVLFSPVFHSNNQRIGKDLAEWILHDKLWNTRIQIQMHKILGIV